MLSHLKNAAGRPYIGLAAAGIAYYTFLAMVPLIASAVLIFGIWADPATIGSQVDAVAQLLPGAAGELVGTEMLEIAAGDDTAQGFGLVLAIALSLVAARGAAMAVIDGLDLAYRAQDERSFIRRNALALGITVAGILGLGLIALAIGYAGFTDGILSSIISYSLLFVAVLLGAALLYRRAPDRHRPHWKETLPGAALFAAAWLVGTAGFGTYVANFGNYDATYGSLGAIVILLTWIWLSAYLLLLGAAFNSSRQGID